MQYENPFQSFNAFLASIKDAEPETLPELDEISDYLKPFLLNPEKHSEHVKKLLSAASNSGLKRITNLLLRFYDIPVLRRIFPFRDKLSESIKEFADEVERLGPSLRDSVQPAELSLDILPIKAAKTDPSYSAIGMGVICTEVKIGVRPADGFRVHRISLDLNFDKNKSIQILNASPETMYEVLGEREIQTGETGKIAASSNKNVEANLGAKAFGYEARVKFVDSETQQAEYAQSTSKILKDRPTIPRVSCTDVGANVHWDLYETPTQQPMGGIDFSCNLLVPKSEEKIDVEMFLNAHLSSWGPMSTRYSRTIPLVFYE